MSITNHIASVCELNKILWKTPDKAKLPATVTRRGNLTTIKPLHTGYTNVTIRIVKKPNGWTGQYYKDALITTLEISDILTLMGVYL